MILASSLIPGNENAVYRVIDGLTKLGANVVHKGNAKVHVSGHAAAGELLYCYNILQAQERAAGARRVPPPHRQRPPRAGTPAIPPSARILAENGTVVDLRDGDRQRRRASSTSASCTSTARRVGEITDADLKDRRILGEEGFISVIVVVDAATGRIIIGPGDPRARLRRGRRGVRRRQAEDRRRARGGRPARASATPHALSQIVRRTIGRWVNQSAAGRDRPLVIDA